MRASTITAAGLAAVLALAALPMMPGAARAADLYGEGAYAPPHGYAGEADEDYDDEPYQSAQPQENYRSYKDSYVAEPPAGSIKDGYPVPMPPPARYSDAPPPERYGHAPPPRRVERYACLDRGEIRHRLRGEGWADIRPLGGDGNLVAFRARRYESGRAFRITVDRCSGEVLAARPQHLRSLTYRDRERAYRRWSRHY